MGRIFKLGTLLKEEDVAKVAIGDVVYFSGELYTMRDQAHLRAIELLRKMQCLPFSIRNGVIYHCGPLVKDGRAVSAGPTTSMRMEKSEPDLIRMTGLRAIIGKGGMGGDTLNALKMHNALYLEYPGGVGALAARAVRRIRDVYWRDLGDPEAVWVMEVEDFGPCFVTMDNRGQVLRKNS